MKMNVYQLIFSILLLQISILIQCQALDDFDDGISANRTPIYVIANMANSINEAETFLNDGANGLQIDVQFSPMGVPKATQHGLPCHCGRNCMKSENFKDYLEFLRRTTTLGTKNYNQRLSIIFMNLKIAGLNRALLYSSGEKFADDIINYLYARGKVSSRAWIVLGLPDVRSLNFVRGFRKAFESANMKWYLERFGYSIQRFSRPDRLKTAFLSAGITDHIWIGTGSTLCMRNTTPQRVIRLASEREIIRKFGNTFVDKIYSWTVDLPNNMRESLRLGIDALITNKPNQMKIILKEAEFEPHLRLADSNDVPWQWKTKSENEKSVSNSNDKQGESNYRLVLDEIDKELDALNDSNEGSNEDDKDDMKLLDKIFPEENDDKLKDIKSKGSFFDQLVNRFKILFT